MNALIIRGSGDDDEDATSTIDFPNAFVYAVAALCAGEDSG